MVLELEKVNEEEQKEIYINYLISEFLNATGQKNNYVSYQDFESEFLDWLKERKKFSRTYGKLIDYVGIDYRSPFAVEVGKGTNDTIVRDRETAVITPFPYVVKDEFFRTIIPAKLKIAGQQTKGNRLVSSSFKTFVTHNPYNAMQIENWEYLLNDGKYNVALGVFGNTYDKDKKSKIDLLKEIKSKINRNFKEESMTENDMYGYIIATTQRERIRERVRCR